jgi:large repetitive protein
VSGWATWLLVSAIVAVPAVSSAAAVPTQAARTQAALVAAVPEAADPPAPIDVTKSGPSSTLVGEPVRYTLTASNPTAGAGGAPQFNVSFSDVLPPGVTYVAGSTRPADIGDPTVVTDPTTGAQTLIWPDTFDLPPGGANSISFEVTADQTDWPVQSTFTDTATGFSSTDARVVPQFDSTGAPVPNPAVTASLPSPASTDVTALAVTKAEPSPEAKLLRGVHDHTTVYTLTVTNGDGGATDDVVVTDFLPASLEFLQCGGVDNTTTGPEYPGAPSLAATPAVPNCPTPVAVDTVSAPAGLPAGVYTEVTWDVGTLAPGQVLTINYAAGIPQRANTLIFPGGMPSPPSLGQAANLDNNIGHTTRQNGAAAGLTNFVDVSGTYAGTVEAGGSAAVDVQASHAVTVNDLRIIKSVSPTDFESGGLATYTLNIASSEYVDNSDITVTDIIPNGICPLDTTRNYVTGSPPDCDPGTVAPSVPYQSVTQNADGTFTVVFDPIDVPRNGAATITFQARMRTTFTGGPLAGDPTATGDSFTNTATEVGTSTPIAGSPDLTPTTVTDSSSVTQTSSGGTVTKLMQPRVAAQNCADNTYAKPAPTQASFNEGDRMCFEITANFASANDTVNPVVTDYLPLGTTLEAGSIVTGPDNTLPADQINLDESSAADDILHWTLGAPQPTGELAVDPGSVFQVRFSAIVTTASPTTAPLATTNYAKLQAQNSTGHTSSLRDLVSFQINPAPPVSVLKGVDSVNGVPAGGNPPNVDHVQVKEGDVVVFRVDVTNPPASTSAVQSVQSWDVLAPGITCADVSAISSGGVCTNPGNPNQPPFAQAATRSAIVWNRPSSEVINPDASVTFTYAVTIPAGTAAGTDLVDTASVRSFDIQNNVPGNVSTFFPANNVDTTVPAADQNAPAASDNSDVFIAAVAVTKNVASAVNEAGNVGGEPPPGAPSTQATIGEQVTYTIFADIPADATVYDGVLSDPVPTGLTPLSASAGFSPSAGSLPPTQPLPPGVTFDASTATLTLPPVFDNTSAVPVRFAVTIVARVTTATSNVAGVNLANTATFTAGPSPGGLAPQPSTATAHVAIVEPAPSLAKSANHNNVVGGQRVTYTLTAGNAAGASVLHDAWVVDCVPAGLAFDAYGTPSQGTTVAPTPGAGTPCATGTTQLEWNVGDVQPGAAPSLTYTATVTPDATGKQTFTNTATVTGDSLAGARTGPTDPGDPNGRLYTTTATHTITVLGAGLIKTVTPSTATIGQTVTYTVVGILSPNVSFFNLTGIDTLPTGLDATSVQVQSVACVNLDGTACTLPAPTPLAPVTSGAGTQIGLFFGDVAGAPEARVITVVYSVRVADVAAAKAGATLTNSAHIAWDNTATPPPTSAGAAFDQTSTSASAPITVVEPAMTITKSVNDTTVEPGQTFHYTLNAINAGTATTSAAFNVTVSDIVPAGVVVNPASITNGGVLTGANSGTGAGGTITWTVPGPIDPGGSIPLGYDATLAPSGGLTTAPQVNQADVTGYDSLPSGGRHYPATPTASAPVTPVFPFVQATKSAPQGTVAFVGEPFTWQITLTNTGAGTADAVRATDTLPPNWSYDNNSAMVSVNGGPASQIDPIVSRSGSILVWANLTNLAPGGSLTITYTATPTADVATSPGVGLSVAQTNTVAPFARDATGATANQSGSYAGPSASAVAHIASSDLSLTKTVGTQPIAGATGSWTVVVGNLGPDTATGPFTVTDGFNDPAPAGVTNITASGTGWSCTTDVPLTCTRTNTAETLAANAQFPPITVSYNVASDVPEGTAFSNAATVEGRNFDPNLDNNSGQASTTVGTKADLAISKTLTSPQLVAGDPAAYAVAVTNLGPSVSAGPFTITDTLPPTSTFISATGTGWECLPIAEGTVGATLTCTYTPDLAVGAVTGQLVVTVGIPSSQTTAVVNTAAITSTTTPDPNPANNTATVTTTPVTSADLTIQKQHVGTFVAGDDAQYTLEVRNFGPSDAADATITDTLPDGVTFLASGDGDWSCAAAGQQVTCIHAAPFPAGTTSTVTLNVHLASDLDTSVPIENTAVVSSTTSDPDPDNNSSTDTSDINASADLAITKQHTGDATAGDPFQYTLAVTNNGPSDVPGPVTVIDPLPSGLTYVSATGTGWTCVNPSGNPPDPRLVTCTLSAGLAAEQTAPDITLNVIVDPDAGPSTIVNTATVSSATPDPNLDNNAASDPTTVDTLADMALSKTLDTPTPVLAGTEATFTLQVSNLGPSDAADVAVIDTLPQFLEFVSATGDGWTCAASGNDVVCTRPTVAAVPPGAPVPPITLVTLVDPGIPLDPPDGTTTVTNPATVQSATPDPNTDNNSASAIVPIAAEANLSLTKQPSTTTPTAGTSFTWTLVAHNNGPSDAADPLTVTDTLPAFETYLSAGAPWSCIPGSPPATPTDQQTVTCTLDSGLAVNADAPPLDLLVQLSADAPAGDQTNTASATSPTPGEPGTGTGTVTVQRSDQLTITKTHSGRGVVGQPINFEIQVHNAGPSVADQLIVTDPLPAGLTYISATGTDWTCSQSGVQVACQLAGTLGVGADAPPITLTVSVEAAAYDHVINVATVSSTDPDLPGRASASDQLTVDPDAALTLTKTHTNQFTVGGQGTYLLTVTNTGPTATPGPIVITDRLPAGLTYVSATGDGWACTQANGQLTCTHAGGLDVGGSSSFTLTVGVQAGAAPSVTNTATATAPGSPPASATDTASVTDSPSPPAAASQKSLAFTGLDIVLFVLSALALIGLGILAIFAIRRRRPGQSAS